MPEEFRERLIQHAKLAVERAPRATTEAATNQYLVLPFLQLLGYDPLNPDEVMPEVHASFSEKFKNRVDFAIYRDGQAVIAVECKKVGCALDDRRGELKGYFNAVPTVKLGILTDGIAFQLFTDTGAENMMDNDPFIAIDLSEVARGNVSAEALDALLRLRKGTFDPADVGADARRKIFLAGYVRLLEASFREPPESLIRHLMDVANVEGRRTSRLLEEHTPIIREALKAVFDRMVLERVGFGNREDLVRVQAILPAQEAEETPAVVAEDPTAARVVTTEAERAVYEHTRFRLAFLLGGDEAAYGALSKLQCVDYKTVFCVYYKQERKGRVFNFWEGTLSPKFRFEFATGEQVHTDDLTEIDAPLVASFRKRVEEVG